MKNLRTEILLIVCIIFDGLLWSIEAIQAPELISRDFRFTG